MTLTIVMESGSVWECETLAEGVDTLSKHVVKMDKPEPSITSIFNWEKEIELDSDVVLKFEQDLYYAIQVERQASEANEQYHRDCEAMIYRSVPCAG